jgi:hypothetical protein
MTDLLADQHPITPPPELIAKWASSMCGYYQAARWGADQELEACCEWLEGEIGATDPEDLRATRRPKPHSFLSPAAQAVYIAFEDATTPETALSSALRAASRLLTTPDSIDTLRSIANELEGHHD